MKNSVKKNDFEWIYGFHAVFAALKNSKRNLKNLFVTKTAKKHLEEQYPNFSTTNLDKCCVHETSNEKIDEIIGERVLHQGYLLQSLPLSSPPLEIWLKELPQRAIIIMLDGVTDPQNVGAIFRSAAALKADAIVTTHHHSVPQTSTLIKIASGAAECLPYIKVTNLCQTIDILKKYNFWCYGLAESGGLSLSQIQFPERVILILGSEDKGIRPLVQKHCDERVVLPTCNTFTTLNVSNAAALALYEASKQVKGLI